MQSPECGTVCRGELSFPSAAQIQTFAARDRNRKKGTWTVLCIVIGTGLLMVHIHMLCMLRFELCIVFIFVNAAHIVMLLLCVRGEKNKDRSPCCAPLKLYTFILSFLD